MTKRIWDWRFLIQVALAALALVATAWLLWPGQSRPAQSGWQDDHEPKAFFVPTASATITRATVQRPPTSTPFVPTATPEPVIHVVQPGDVLGIIAKQYGITEKAIMEANGLKSDLIIDGQELVIPSPQRTPLPSVTRTPTVTPTPTSTFRYAEPVLLEPADGAIFQGRDARIVLQWASVAILQEGEWYEVKLWSAQQGEAQALRFYTQASTWIVPSSLYPTQQTGIWYWTVSVVYRARRNIPLSPAASARPFQWR